MTQKSKFQEMLNDSPVPVLVDFWADWCMPCRMMHPVLEQLSQSQAEKLKVIKVDIDKNPSASTKFNVRSVPTMILFSKGQEIWRQVGAVPFSELETQLRPHLPK